MPRYEVACRSAGSVQVEAGNWLSALGDGLAALELLPDLDRLACEVLPNGHVLARDVRSGRGFVVQALGGDVGGEDISDEPTVEEEEALAVDEAEFLDEQEALGGPARPEDEQSVTAPHVAVEIEDPDPSAPVAPAADDADVLRAVEAIQGAQTPLFAWHEALDAARRLCPAESGAALELEPDGRLRFVYAFGPRATAITGAVMPANAGIAGFSVSRIASMLVHDTAADPRFLAEFDQVTGYATQAVLCVPVAWEGRVLGALELINPVDERRFDRAQLELVEVLADSLGAHLAAEGPAARR